MSFFKCYIDILLNNAKRATANGSSCNAEILYIKVFNVDYYFTSPYQP